MTSNNERLSKFISLILRHKPEAIGITLDEFGYANVCELIEGINDSGRYIDLNILKNIVKDDKKGRFIFDESMTLIRANQGHSINVNVELKKVTPPRYLFHGTAKKNLDSIIDNGIKKMNRLYVHLSDNTSTATKVGARHGEPIVLKIDSQKMYGNGFEFYLSENHVWLVEFVPSEYINL
ncbi:RNA 2'-phosphotransferase [Bacillus massiliigorillae]|uniref:RNA 2'-phosphotransferase n=1 Tax=Bacillus massiliigorillae TaxID=1243664 RepID=UPI0003AA020D|nr:RNA 2'-phosphotransferase [Bacillus massiliigorillae]